ncbi:MAG: hypothetical protein PCFJNLEI_00145 [Verrucomicrobiae bacterium]|nr:hypothetical protein [Verrucomicrobiae bacterium]
MAARRDLSGIFDAELKKNRINKPAILDCVFHLSHKGITFFSENPMPEWMEVGVEMRMPVKGARREQQISCRGVVVECTRRIEGRGYQVALVFVDLPKKSQAQLDMPPTARQTFSISLAR